MLKKLFSSSTRVDVLALLLGSPGERRYVREIAKLLQKNPSGVKRELDILEQTGVVLSERVANLRYYRANRRSPVYDDLKGLVTKGLGLQGAIRSVVRAAGARSAFIYGPYAEGRKRGSVDLMVVGTSSDLVKGFREIERSFGCSITWIEMDEEEYRTRRRKREPRLTGILSEKRIPLVGRV